MINLKEKKMFLKLKLVFHIFICLIGFISVVLHIIYSPAPLVSTTKFTIHSNLLVAITFLLSSFAILLKKSQNSLLDYIKNCSVIYMIVAILTYHFLLSSGGEYSGPRIITNFTLHYLIPILVFINWAVFEVKKKYSYKFIFYWIIYPVFYCVVSCLRGLIDGFYPYFFFNPHAEIPEGVGSYINVALFITSFTFVFIILGLLLVTLNRVFLFIKNKNNPSSAYHL
ncbi:Pr6Pr family membrane protein [Fredinandcohnia quinoae]|uniref:Pr6Pr family membrane protein n=1 Tax=Fredinandcohnia quinoae TaxID=2918902 RepID=A0AAW5E6A2_9BACI|nr:Pr6Pr family membrane protein [Fredinandcohnia sp. SECRCQ15]MCH1627883.1 Pr6Pr family membrane protein [Fredinandcohnia sp. SECRCQ15]